MSTEYCKSFSTRFALAKPWYWCNYSAGRHCDFGSLFRMNLEKSLLPIVDGFIEHMKVDFQNDFAPCRFGRHKAKYIP